MSVAIQKGREIKTNLKKIFDELAFKPGKRVYVKPNLSGRDPVLPGENTSVEIMDALIEILNEFDCEIIIGHGALLGSDDYVTSFSDTIKWAGFEKYMRMKKVRIINLDDLERTEIRIDEMTFHLPLDFLKNEIDTYINLAKIKTHMETIVSFSLKNQMGLPSPADRVMMHKTDLEMTIAKLALHCKPDINILEGFPAMEKNGPHHGEPVDLKYLVAGDDMVELDSFMCRLLKIDPKNVPHIQNATTLGVGRMVDENVIKKHREYIVDEFDPASKVYKFGRQLRAYPTYSCSRCINVVNLAGKEFKKHPLKYFKVIFAAFFSKKTISIVFGKADKLKNNPGQTYICIGNCAKTFAQKNGYELLDQCPPGVEEAREYIINEIVKNDKT